MSSDPPGERAVADGVIVVATLALAAVYFYATQQLRVFAFGDPVGPRAFPQLLCIGLVASAAMLLVEMRAARRARSGARPSGPPGDRRPIMAVAGTVVLTAVYFALFVPLGYAFATSLFLLALTTYFHPGKLLANTLASVGFGLLSYLAFTRVLGASLPPGVLPF